MVGQYDVGKGIFRKSGSGAPGQIRTADTRFRRAVLYPLSYGGQVVVLNHDHPV